MIQLALLTFSLFILSACNLYAPFGQRSSNEDLIEAARKCLHDGDFECAIEAYTEISSLEVRSEKLCGVNLAKAGMTLSMLINTISKNSSKMLGDLAQAYAPWTPTKGNAIDEAKTHCTAFANNASTVKARDQAALLKTVALMSHCSIRIAKADLNVATSDSDTTCNTPGNGNGIISQNDVTENADGSITTTGMCAADVRDCNADLSAIDGDALSNAGISGIKNALDQIPDALKNSDSSVIGARGALRDSVN